MLHRENVVSILQTFFSVELKVSAQLRLFKLESPE